jgi:hypothetical protein
MTRWAPLLEVTVEHGFFANGLARGLRFEPTEDTAAWLRGHDAVCRESGAGLLVALPMDSEAAADEPAHLAWRVHCNDALLAGVTEGLPSPGTELLHWCATLVADDPTRLHTQIWPLTWPAVAETLDPVARRQPPLALLSLPRPTAPMQVRVRLAPRRTVWKYWLLGDWSADPLQVVDPAREVDFTDPAPEPLGDGRVALAVRSQSSIVLAQRSEARFQLRSRGAAVERVLVKRLPVAGADHFARETIHGVTTLVSEIYVHR